MENLVKENKAFSSTQSGVKNTEVGYLGGINENPTYRNHPKHAEGLEITYDSNETSYNELS